MSSSVDTKTSDSDPTFLNELDALNPTERAFLDAVKKGAPFDAGGASLSAEFMQKLLLFTAQIPNAVTGIRLNNCTVAGSINVSGAKIEQLVAITESVIEGDFCCDYTEFKALFLDGTKLRKLRGTRCKASASIYLRARVCGDASSGKAVTIKRFHATEGVNLSGAHIIGALSARGAVIDAPQRPEGSASQKPIYALNLADTHIGSIILGPKEKEEIQHTTANGEEAVNVCTVNGGITFQRARCRAFNDSEQIYGNISNLEYPLVLKGFQYETLGRYAPRDFKFRKKWLNADAGPDKEFAPQPFEQLSKVMIAQGETSAAKEILIQKEHQLLDHATPRLKFTDGQGLLSRLWGSLRWVASIIFHQFKFFVMWSIGFGYRLQRLIPVMLLVIAFGTAFYSHAYNTGGIVPSSALVARSTAWLSCNGVAKSEPRNFRHTLFKPSQLTKCKKQSLHIDHSEADRALYFYPDFSPFWYSVDVFLPILTLRQQEFWVGPDQQKGWISVRSFSHILSLVGWFLSSLGIVGALGYLNRS